MAISATICAFFLVVFLATFAGALFFAYLLISRSESITEDMLDRIQFGRSGDYLLIRYERQKLRTERKDWFKKKEQPLPKESVPAQPTKEEVEKQINEILTPKNEGQEHAKKVKKQAEDFMNGGFEIHP